MKGLRDVHFHTCPACQIQYATSAVGIDFPSITESSSVFRHWSILVSRVLVFLAETHEIYIKYWFPSDCVC